MNLKRDYFGQITEPQYILTKPSNERIGVIKCIAKDISISFNAPSEISFETALYIDGEKNPLYDNITQGQFVEVIDYGRFVITSCETTSAGTQNETMKCSAISREVLLGQKYLEHFTVNMGTTESIDNVPFYNMQDPEHSLLHLVLNNCPDWEIGHVDTSLLSLHRCFEESRTDIYSFLTDTMAAAFQCVFLFDSYNNRINIYSEDSAGVDTDIYVTYQNLLKSTSISSSLDDIKTCLTVTGADGLNIREVNMGYDRIYMLDYFATTEYMSYDLYHAYNIWKAKWNDHLPAYNALLSQYQKYYEDINYETNEKMPSDPTSTIWSDYGLIPLQEKQKSYEAKLAIMIKAGQGEPSHKDYNSLYLPCYNTVQSIKAQIGIAETAIKRLKEKQSAVGAQMDAIISDVSMTNNFTARQLKELTLFIREDELSSDNYVVTDTMTDSQRMDMLEEMLEFGRKELRRVSQPQYQFSASMLNLCAIPEFDRNAELFDVGNYIHIILRDDYMVKAKILQLNVNFLDVNDFNVTFGTLSKLSGSNIFSDITQAINTAASVSTTVSFNASHWNKANREVNDINKMLSEGLLAAGESLKTARSDVEIDDRGIIISNTPESVYQNDKIFIGDGKILFSDDGLKTIKTAIGHLTYTKKGTTYTDFGVLAQFLIAGYISGSTIEGNEIIGSTFNNGNGTFSVDENGVLSAARGRIGCDQNGNGGFIIDSNKLYSGKDSITSDKSGVYLGTDGIALGANNLFSVTSQGYLTAKSGTIGGAVIANNSIHASNGNWCINSDGSVSFKNVVITGQSTLGSDIVNPFSGTTIPHIQTLAANYIKVNYLDAIHGDIRNLKAKDADIEKLVADKADISALNAATAEIEDLKVGKLSVADFNADNISAMNITVKSANVTGGFSAAKITTGTLTTDRLDVDGIITSLASKTIQCVNFTAQTIRGSSFQIYNGSGYSALRTYHVTIDDKTYQLIGI